ncbi:hypothetical protein TSAR_006740 [Trichomalopsis sarcophagae]|uniref:Uncharacterized protein n=1 Tax=Trichomalopsis sarcophagae TaxID=543379 RepID=A0A232F114_9HYME|nr:hypothetical protein TSAR_006740 [Trichomalopsis sarcophagae]
MEDSDAQELFLLEFLVDRVNIPSVQAMHDDVLLVKTCIEFKILNLPPIYICQDTSHDNCTCLGADAQVFRKGKSCLFALPSKLLKTPLCSFPITMSVYKKLPPTVLPDIMTIGTCQIEIRDMINCLLQESLLTSQNPCKTLKNNFRISTATGQCVGEVCVFLRFSRLGRKVVTQFQNPHNKKPYLFKECQSENRGHTPYKSLFETQGEKETRQCGCDIKEDKSPACRKRRKMPGKAKKKSKNGNGSEERKKLEGEAEKSLKLKQQEEERQRAWNEAWERKIREDERLEDCKACCAPDEFFPKPRTQTNIWVQINHEKNTQHVQMAFQNVPVPKPKPPPLPRLQVIEPPGEERNSDPEPIVGDGKKSEKKKKKKKK